MFFLQKITKSNFSNKENLMVKRCKDHYLIEMWNTIYGLTDSFFNRSFYFLLSSCTKLFLKR